MNIRPLSRPATVAVFLLAGAATGFAQDQAAVSAQTSAYRDSIAQDELRTSTTRI